jgi:hypothetical protein
MGQPRRSDETSRMSALPLIAVEWCTAFSRHSGPEAGIPDLFLISGENDVTFNRW